MGMDVNAGDDCDATDDGCPKSAKAAGKPASKGDAGRRNGEAAINCMLIAFLLIAGAVLSGFMGAFVLMVPCVLGAFGVAGLGVLRGMMSFKQTLDTPRLAEGRFVAGVVLASIVNGLMVAFGVFVTFSATMGFSRGRQLRRFGRVLLPEVGPGGAWAQVPMDPAVEESVRAELAAQWRENGRTEHASVAAFARLTLDLMALGAPPQLVADANRDALDEIRHTELCFSLARELDGRSESPGPFPAALSARTLPPGRVLALAALAVDSLVDGALHEGVSARVIARLAKVCEEPRIRAVLKEIAADEGRHAAHGWDVVEWCLAEGGAAVAAALRGALRALPAAMRGAIPGPAEAGAWQRYGIHGRALEAEEYAKTRADLVLRVQRLLAPAAVAA